MVAEAAVGVQDTCTAMPQSYGVGTAICFKRKGNKPTSGLWRNVGTTAIAGEEASWKVLLRTS